ncbi:MAG: acyltransferase [Prevotella sp.]|nr:acyltransferase [Prevotella sp.]
METYLSMQWGGVKIGHHCHIAKGLTIYSHNHNWRSKDYIPYDKEVILRPIEIGDCVWIGCNVTLAPGTKIGDGCIVSAGSVVFGVIPSCSIIRGNPAIVIGERDKKTYSDLYSKSKFF